MIFILPYCIRMFYLVSCFSVKKFYNNTILDIHYYSIQQNSQITIRFLEKFIGSVSNIIWNFNIWDSHNFHISALPGRQIWRTLFLIHMPEKQYTLYYDNITCKWPEIALHVLCTKLTSVRRKAMAHILLSTL